MAIVTEEKLDLMRHEGDPRADGAIHELCKKGKIRAVRALLDKLVRNDDVVPDELPEQIKSFWAMARDDATAQAKRLEAGEKFFADHGPEIILILGFYSLPMDYAARGVRVLRETGELVNNTNRRVFETMQMVIDVMSPGGLASDGKGIASALKVRLMHAAVRAQILQCADDPILQQAYRPWDKSLGKPINQEDLVGTLMSFSYLILDGLEKLGIEIKEVEKETYLAAWSVIGKVLGIFPDLIPENFDEARQLSSTIMRRQIEPTEDSRVMISALLKMYQEKLRIPIFKSDPAALMRFFLPAELADKLGVPRTQLYAAVQLLAPLTELLDWFMRRVPSRWLIRQLSIRLLQLLVDTNRGGSRSKFAIPTSLEQYWKVSP